MYTATRTTTATTRITDGMNVMQRSSSVRDVRNLRLPKMYAFYRRTTSEIGHPAGAAVTAAGSPTMTAHGGGEEEEAAGALCRRRCRGHPERSAPRRPDRHARQDQVGASQRRGQPGRDFRGCCAAGSARGDRADREDRQVPGHHRILLPGRRYPDSETGRLLPDGVRGRRDRSAAQRGRRRGVGRAFDGDPARELRVRAEAFGDGPAGRFVELFLAAGFGTVFFLDAAFLIFSAVNREAIVGALRAAAFRLLIQTFSGSTSSTVRPETTDCGATVVTSTFSFAYSSRCFSSSHSLPLSDFERPPILTSAHSPNIFFPNILKVSLPDFRAFTGSSPGSMNSHVPLSQMITLPAP